MTCGRPGSGQPGQARPGCALRVCRPLRGWLRACKKEIPTNFSKRLFHFSCWVTSCFHLTCLHTPSYPRSHACAGRNRWRFRYRGVVCVRAYVCVLYRHNARHKAQTPAMRRQQTQPEEHKPQLRQRSIFVTILTYFATLNGIQQ